MGNASCMWPLCAYMCTDHTHTHTRWTVPAWVALSVLLSQEEGTIEET